MAMMCKDCGASVPTGASFCPRCRSLDLVLLQGALVTGRAGEDSVEAYHRFTRRRRFAMLVTATTTLVLVVISLVLAGIVRELVPGGVGSAGGIQASLPQQQGFDPIQVLWMIALFLVVNPYILVGFALALGVFSYRLWFWLFTGQRTGVEFSIIDALGGRVRPQS